MGRLSRRCIATFGLLLVFGPPVSAAASRPAVVSGPGIVRELRAGRPVVLQGVRVTGPFDLTAADSVDAVFKCRECTFGGRVRASDVTFERTVDLSGATFTRSVDFRGATFASPALFRTSLTDRDGRVDVRRAVFAARADFSLAFFMEFSSFSGAVFTDTAAFRDSRFSDASFASTMFGEAAFERATFRGAALFNNATFNDTGTFSDADFRKRADFSLARFDGGGIFTRVQFGEDASFLGASFSTKTPSTEAGRFDDVAAARNLNFTFVRFDIDGKQANRSSALAVFSDLVCGGSLVFRQAKFGNGVIEMERLQARDLVLDVDVVSQINDEERQREVLQMIEDSGKARGDLAAANDAHYALRADRSKDYSTIGHALDYVFYRGVAGYFVRPMRPLLVLLFAVSLLSLASVIQARRRRQSDPSPVKTLPRRRRMWNGTKGRCGDFLTCFLDKLGLVRPQRSEGNESPPLGRRLESFAYRLLVVCAILGLANSNPTLRQMVDTLF